LQQSLQLWVFASGSIRIVGQSVKELRLFVAKMLQGLLGLTARRWRGIAQRPQQGRSHLHPYFFRKIANFGPTLQTLAEIECTGFSHCPTLIDFESFHPQRHDHFTRNFWYNFQYHFLDGRANDLHRLRVYRKNHWHDIFE
jgi:hypothetical protein